MLFKTKFVNKSDKFCQNTIVNLQFTFKLNILKIINYIAYRNKISILLKYI